MNTAHQATLHRSQFGKPVYAVKFIRPMRGSSGANLVVANDNFLYVVKTSGNPHQPNLLANEFLGSALARAVGLPVASTKSVMLSQSFLDTADLSLPGLGRVFYPQPGLHYGSQLVLAPSPSHFLAEYLSPCRIPFVRNRGAFLGMYILDIWAKHLDSRQAVVIQERGSTNIEVTFIDHGHMFGGPAWDFESNKCIFCPVTASMYSDLRSSKAVHSWIRIFRKNLPQALDGALALLPPWWFSGNLKILQEWLHQRLRDLPALVDQQMADTTIFKESLNEKLYLPNHGIRQVRIGS